LAFWNRQRAESRSLPRPENELPLFGSYVPSTVSPAQALAIADVWAAVRVLADAASSLPIHVYRKADTGRERVTSGFLVDLLESLDEALDAALVSENSLHGLRLTTKNGAQDGVEEEHRLAAEGAVRAASLKKHHGRSGDVVELNLARDVLNRVVEAKLVYGSAHRCGSPIVVTPVDATRVSAFNVRRPISTESAWYTRATRWDIEVATSHGMVVRARAN